MKNEKSCKNGGRRWDLMEAENPTNVENSIPMQIR